MIFKIRNTHLRSNGTNFFIRYIPSSPPSSSSSSSSQGSSSGGSSQGPNSVLACGFGSFNDGQFTSAGYFNNYEYYTYIDGATTWYLFYDTTNTRYTISTILANGNTHYYNFSGYISFDWVVSSGSLPVGDTYDYALTSQCPQSSSSSSSSGSSFGSGNTEGPTAILACGFGSFNDGQFASAGYYNNYEYYTLIDGATTWYLFYDGNSQYIISSSLGGTIFYYSTSYIYNDWIPTSVGSVPGGDTYDYALTSQCPSEGPTAILACGFGSFSDGQFASAGYYNNYEYYTLLDGATTWYLFYNGGGQFVISLSLGGTIYYYSSSYIYNDWIPSSGASPGGDTYDYDLTSQCPATSSSSNPGSSSSSSSSSSGPETPTITSIGYDGITFQWSINISNFGNFMMPSWLIQYSTDNSSWNSSFSPSNSSNPYLYVDESSGNLPTYGNGTDFYVRVSADNGSNWSSSYFVDN